MSREFLSYDPLNRITEYHTYDPLTGDSIIESVGEYEDILDVNKKIANDAEVTKQGIKNDFWLYASIPPIVQVKLLREHGINVWKREDGPRLSRLLEDPEWRYLKTTSKRHIIKCK